MSGTPVLSVSISPYLVTTSARHTVQQVTVTDKGSAPLAISAGFRSLQTTGRGCAMAQPPSWVTASPAKFTIRPGHSRTVTLTVNAPPSATGHYDLLAVMNASPLTGAHPAMGDTVTGGISTRVLVNLGGTTTAKPCAVAVAPTPKAVASSGPGGIPLAGIVALVAILAVIVLAVTVVRRRTRQP